MTAIYSIAGLNYQIDVTVYCILRSLLKLRFLSCKIEVDIEIESDDYKNMDLFLNLREPTDSIHLFEIKDVHNLNQSSKLEPVVNELFKVYKESKTKIEKIYLVHSAPSIDELSALRDSKKKVKIITSYRKKHLEKNSNKKPIKGRTKSEKSAAKGKKINHQVKAEVEQIKKFSKNFHLVHLPNCKDRLLDNNDLKLRIEALIRQLLNKIHVNELVDCRQIREAFSTGNIGQLSRLFDKMPVSANAMAEAYCCMMEAADTHQIETHMRDVVISIAGFLFNEDITDCNENTILNIGKENYEALLTATSTLGAPKQLLMDKLLQAIIVSYAQAVTHHFGEMSKTDEETPSDKQMELIRSFNTKMTK